MMRKRGLYAEKARPGTELLLGTAQGPKRSGRIGVAKSLGGRAASNGVGAAPDWLAKLVKAVSNEVPTVVRGSRSGDPLALRDRTGDQQRRRISRVQPDSSPASPAKLKAAAKRTNEMKAGGYVDPPAYDPNPGEGREVAYQNLMRSLGHLNTQDFSDIQKKRLDESSTSLMDGLHFWASLVSAAATVLPGPTAARVAWMLVNEGLMRSKEMTGNESKYANTENSNKFK